jgi:hypothetical protein
VLTPALDKRGVLTLIESSELDLALASYNPSATGRGNPWHGDHGHFTSTTRTSELNYGAGRPYLLEIKLSAGITAAHLTHTGSENHGENEFLVQRGAQYKVVDDKGFSPLGERHLVVLLTGFDKSKGDERMQAIIDKEKQ